MRWVSILGLLAFACGPSLPMEVDGGESTAPTSTDATTTAESATTAGTSTTITTDATDSTGTSESDSTTAGSREDSSGSSASESSAETSATSRGSTDVAGICGDGVVDDGESCDPGGGGEGICNADCTCVLSSTTWQQTHDGPGDVDDEARDIAAAADGWFVAVGFEGAEDLLGLGNVHIRRVAADGTPSWSSSPDADGTSSATAVAIASDGTVLVAGNTDLDAANNDGCPSWFATAYDASGVELWSASEAASCRYTHGAVATADGFVLVGSVSGMAGSYGLIHAYDLDGGPLWDVEQPFVENTGFNDAVMVDGGALVVVAGSRSQFGGGEWAATLEAFALDGTPVWAYSFPAPDDDTAFEPSGVATAPDGTFRVAGSVWSNGVVASRVAAWTDAGDESWALETADERASAIVVLPDSTMLVAGSVGDGGIMNDALVLHVASDGSQSCRLTLAGPGGGNDRASSLARAPDGAVLVAGQRSSQLGDEDFWMARLGI